MSAPDKSTDHRAVLLYGTDGCTLVRQTKIVCVGDLPPLIVWDDSPDGERTFTREAGCSYREQVGYVLSIGEVRK